MSEEQPEENLHAVRLSGVLHLIYTTDDGLEFTVKFPVNNPARYRRRLNHQEDGKGIIVKEFLEHEIFWTEDV